MYKNNTSLVLGGSLLVVAAVLLWLVRPSSFNTHSVPVTPSQARESQTDSSRQTNTASQQALRPVVLAPAATYTEQAQQLLQSQGNSQAWQALLQVWALSDFDQALLWLSQNTEEQDRDFYIYTLGKALVLQDAATAATVILHNPALYQNAQLVSFYATTVAQSDPQSALDWLGGIADAGIAQSAIFSVYEHLVQHAPHRALDFVIQQQWQLPPAEFESLLGQSAYALAQQRRPDSVWLQQYPLSIQSQLAYNLAASWANEQYELTAWLEHLPNTAVKDRAVHGALDYSREVYTPTQRLDLAAVLSGSQDRRQALQAEVQAWSEQDVDTAKAYITQATKLAHDDTEWLLQLLVPTDTDVDSVL